MFYKTWNFEKTLAEYWNNSFFLNGGANFFHTEFFPTFEICLEYEGRKKYENSFLFMIGEEEKLRNLPGWAIASAGVINSTAWRLTDLPTSFPLSTTHFLTLKEANWLGFVEFTDNAFSVFLTPSDITAGEPLFRRIVAIELRNPS